VAPAQAQLDARARPGQRADQVRALSQELGHQVTRPRLARRFGGQRLNQRFGLPRPIHHEQRPRQRRPRIDVGRAAVLQRAHEPVGSGGGIVGEQPLFPRTGVGLGPRHR